MAEIAWSCTNLMNKREQILFVKHGRLFFMATAMAVAKRSLSTYCHQSIIQKAQKTNAPVFSNFILLHEDPKTVRAPSFNEIRFRAFEHHATATDGTALLRGSDHAFDDFA